MEIAKAFVTVQTDMSQAPKDIQRGTPPVEGAMQNLAGSLNSILATVGVGLGMARIMSEAQQAIGLTSRQIDAEARVAAVIRTTGGAAGFTADELKKMASSFQAATRVGDEAILEIQAKFLTFKSIQGEVFERGIELALDMAAVMGTDARNAAIQMAMALEDPVRGVTRLRRAGVTFSDQQMVQIRNFQETNQLAKAQALVLEVIEGQLGGVAKAMAETDPGKIEQLDNAIGDVKEEIGEKLLPVMIAFKEMSLEMWEAISAGGHYAAEVFKEFYGVFSELNDLLGGLLGPTVKWLMGLFVAFTGILVTATVVLKAFAMAKAFVISLTGVGIPLVAAAAATATGAMVALSAAAYSMKRETESLADSAKKAKNSYGDLAKEAENARRAAASAAHKEDIESMGSLSLHGLDEEIVKHEESVKLAEEKVQEQERSIDVQRKYLEQLEKEKGWLRESERFEDQPEREQFLSSIESLERNIAVHEQAQAQALEEQGLAEEQINAAKSARESIEQDIRNHLAEQHKQNELNKIGEIDSLDNLRKRITLQKESLESILQTHGPNSTYYQQAKQILEALEDQHEVLEDNLDPLKQAERAAQDLRDRLSPIDIQVRNFGEQMGIGADEMERMQDALESADILKWGRQLEEAFKGPLDLLDDDFAKLMKLWEEEWMHMSEGPELLEKAMEHLTQQRLGPEIEEEESRSFLGSGQTSIGQFGASIQSALLQREDPVVDKLEEEHKRDREHAEKMQNELITAVRESGGGLAPGD